MALIGYARVSTDEQTTAPQIDALKAAGCMIILRENASGANRGRPELKLAVERCRQGDVLVVVRIDRLARSLSHLLEIIEALDARGAGFRSLGDPIDTTSPQGRFTLQILGAVAEFERALIRERTNAGLKAARDRGRIGGNPALRSGSVGAARAVHAARDARFGLPEIGLGLVPGAGGTVSLPRRVGRWRTAFLALSGTTIDTGQARQWGLIDAIEPDTIEPDAACGAGAARP